MRKHFAQTAVILAAVSAIGLTACTQGSASAPIPDTIKVENVKDNVITVQSTEEVKVVPDMAELVFSVTTRAAGTEQQRFGSCNQLFKGYRHCGNFDSDLQLWA